MSRSPLADIPRQCLRERKPTHQQTSYTTYIIKKQSCVEWKMKNKYRDMTKEWWLLRQCEQWGSIPGKTGGGMQVHVTPGWGIPLAAVAQAAPASHVISSPAINAPHTLKAL